MAARTAGSITLKMCRMQCLRLPVSSGRRRRATSQQGQRPDQPTDDIKEEEEVLTEEELYAQCVMLLFVGA